MTGVPKPSDPTSTYTCTYDAWNRLVEVDAGETLIARYTYDGLGRRVKVETPQGETTTYRHFFYTTSWQVLETRTSTTSGTGPDTLPPERQFVWSLRYLDAPVLRDENTDGTTDDLCDDERLYYTTDANQNVTALVNASNGSVVERVVYDPYGKATFYNGSWANPSTTSAYANEVLYTGHRLDPESGLYYTLFRHYHPTLGRWLQRDPLGYVDGMSLYKYVGGDPTGGQDPLGLFDWVTSVDYYADTVEPVGPNGEKNINGFEAKSSGVSGRIRNGGGEDLGSGVVEPGDTLWSIYKSIAKANPDFQKDWPWPKYREWAENANPHIKDMDVLRPGDILHVRPDMPNLSSQIRDYLAGFYAGIGSALSATMVAAQVTSAVADEEAVLAGRDTIMLGGRNGVEALGGIDEITGDDIPGVERAGLGVAAGITTAVGKKFGPKLPIPGPPDRNGVGVPISDPSGRQERRDAYIASEVANRAKRIDANDIAIRATDTSVWLVGRKGYSTPSSSNFGGLTRATEVERK